MQFSVCVRNSFCLCSIQGGFGFSFIIFHFGEPEYSLRSCWADMGNVARWAQCQRAQYQRDPLQFPRSLNAAAQV